MGFGKNIFTGLVSVGHKGLSYIAQGTEQLISNKEKDKLIKDYYKDYRKSISVSSVKEDLSSTKAGNVLLNVGGAVAGTTAVAGVIESVATASTLKSAGLKLLGGAGTLGILSSEKVTDVVTKLPKVTYETTKTIGETIDTSGQNLDNKTLFGLGGVIAGTGLTLAGTQVYDYFKDRKSNKQQILIDNTPSLPMETYGGGGVSSYGVGATPTGRETEVLKETSTTKRKRRKSKPAFNINNRVNIKINNSSTANRTSRKIYKCQYL